MLYNLSNPYDLDKFRERVKILTERKAAVHLTEKRPTRSLAQNAYLHLLLGYFASEFGYTLDEVKVRIFKEQVNAEIFRCKKTNKRGQEIAALRSSAEITTAELSTAIERFRNYSASEAGLYLPSAEDHQLLIFAQQQIDKNKEHL